MTRRGVPRRDGGRARAVGLSGICNIVAAIKVAKYFGLGEDEAVVTVATDGAAMYAQRGRTRRTAKFFPDGFDQVNAGEVCGQYSLGASTDHVPGTLGPRP